MSQAADLRCEFDGCDDPVAYSGRGPRPRWCAAHREEGARIDKRDKQRIVRRVQRAEIASPPVHCDGCGTRLRQPSGDGLCGFCQIELHDAMVKAA